jgi:cold shock CspA family protein
MKSRGIINVWFLDRNYGFIHQVENGVLIRHFLHSANVVSGTPRMGAVVHFDSVTGKKGLLALNASIEENEGNSGGAL